MKDDEFAASIGRTAVNSSIDDLLRSTGGECPPDIDECIKGRLLKPLRAAIESLVAYLPITGLAVQSPLKLGNVEFVSASCISTEARPILENQKFADQTDKLDAARDALLNVFDQSFQGHRGFAKTRVRAHPKFGGDLAINETIVALNVLRSYSMLFYSKRCDAPPFGLPTEIHLGKWGYAVFKQDGSGFSLPNQSIGLPISFTLSEEMHKHLTEKCHLELVSAILAKGTQRNHLEHAITQAFQPMGRTMLATTNDMRIVGATTALERILFHDGEQITVERFADRLAFGFYKGAQTKSIAQRAKRLYDARSKIVHAAWTGSSEEAVAEISNLAIDTILATVARHKNFSSHAAFCQDLQDKRYPGDESI